MIDYLGKSLLPANDREALEIAMTQSQYSVIDGVLYRLAADNSLRVIPPGRNLFEGAHRGVFGGHLRDAKVHGELA